MSITLTDMWRKIAHVEMFPANGGACAKIGSRQIAIFNFGNKQQWYACENQCPHKGDMVLSRGLVGDQSGEPKVACPQHKKTFSLKSGACLSGDNFCVETFPIKVEDDVVFVSMPEKI